MASENFKRKVGQAIIETHDLEEQLAGLLVKIDDNKKDIQKYFDEQGIKNLEVTSSKAPELTLVAKKNERVTINYDAEKLKKKLDPELFLEVAVRKYIINDINGMIELIRNAGISSSDFKKLITTDVSISKPEMKRLYDQKDITMKQIKDCYKATVTKSISIVERKGDTN